RGRSDNLRHPLLGEGDAPPGAAAHHQTVCCTERVLNPHLFDPHRPTLLAALGRQRLRPVSSRVRSTPEAPRCHASSETASLARRKSAHDLSSSAARTTSRAPAGTSC